MWAGGCKRWLVPGDRGSLALGNRETEALPVLCLQRTRRASLPRAVGSGAGCFLGSEQTCLFSCVCVSYITSFSLGNGLQIQRKERKKLVKLFHLSCSPLRATLSPCSHEASCPLQLMQKVRLSALPKTPGPEDIQFPELIKSRLGKTVLAAELFMLLTCMFPEPIRLSFWRGQ